MLIKAHVRGGKSRLLVNLNSVPTITVNSQQSELTVGNWIVTNSTTDPDIDGRFQDICDAIVDGSISLYDCNKAIGYWKPPAQKRAPAAAKKAPATK